MMSAGLHLHAPDEQRSSVDHDTREPGTQQPVFLILRRIVSRWNTTAKVVAVHDNEADALADLVTFRLHEPFHVFAIFVPHIEPGGSA